MQDGNGGIWHIDLNTEKDPEPAIQLYKSHSGAVADIAASPWGSYFVTLGTDGRLYMYNYLTKRMIFHYQFPAKGKCLLWLPLNVSKLNNCNTNSSQQIVGLRVVFEEKNFIICMLLTFPNDIKKQIKFMYCFVY